MARRPTPRLIAFLVIGGLGVVAGIALRRPEATALGLCFLFAVAAALFLAAEPALDVNVRLDRERVMQGETVTVELSLVAPAGCEWVRYLLVLPPGLALRSGPTVRGVRLRPGRPHRAQVEIVPSRWGGMSIGTVVLEAYDRLGGVAWETVVDRRTPLRVHPREEALARTIRQSETQVFAGDEVARTRGEGIEFSEVRAYLPGDLARRINWRRSTRTRELYVNDTHPERNADVVLFLDSFIDVGERDSGTLDSAVRAAVSLARHYIGRRDRVGVVGFGGTLRWLLPGMGSLQLHRIAEALIDTEVMLSYAWKDVDVIPPRTLPPKAMIVALTPLLDERVVTALFDLRRRGFDVVIIEVSPEFAARQASPRRRRGRGYELANRVWRLRRELLRDRYRRLGVPVGVWKPGTPMAPVLEEIDRFKRFARPVRV